MRSKRWPLVHRWCCPRHGAFPELVAATGGGQLVAPDDPVQLAEALHQLLATQPSGADWLVPASVPSTSVSMREPWPKRHSM